MKQLQQNLCNAPYRQHEAKCTLEAGHASAHHAKALMELASGNSWIIELWWIGAANAASQASKPGWET